MNMKRRLTIIAIAVVLIIGFSVIVGMMKKDGGNKGEATKTEAGAKNDGKKEPADGKVYKIGLAQIVEHPSLNTIRDAFLAQMKTLGYTDKNCKIYQDQANGEPSLLPTIMQKYESEKVDVIVPIATPTAVAAANFANKIPVVFSAVSDPIGAQLTTNLEHPDKNITGTSDVIQVEKILDLALKLFPETKKMGFLYNTSEANSVSNIEKAKKFCEEKGIAFQEANVANTSELPQATQALLSDCDIIFSPNDNTVASGIDAVSAACMKAKKPFFVGADSMVADNGFATIGINYEDLGKETANMVDKVLKGTPVSEIPVKEFKDNLNIYINEGVAEAIGFKIPDEIKKDPNFVGVPLKK